LKSESNEYSGFEIGPIRPPSEADSLLLRITRNCPWNRCKFCGVYKDKKFSIRPAEHVIRDIESIKECIDIIKKADKENSLSRQAMLNQLIETESFSKELILSALSWYRSGMKSVFLQDANSLVIKPDDMIRILMNIKSHFTEVERITSYARSDTIARISDQDLKRIASVGLNRIHTGMESGSNTVLQLMKKGADKATHIVAGRKVKKAGIELSEYFMPGLGGVEYSAENALETADAFNEINPDYIRIRTLAITDRSGLGKLYEEGILTRTDDTTMVHEILLLIENLKGISSSVISDHIVNLIPEVEGTLPADKKKMIAALRWFLELDEQEKILYRIGRRTGITRNAKDLSDPARRARAKSFIEEYGINASNIDIVVNELMKRFI
jgi:hypothetical protein